MTPEERKQKFTTHANGIRVGQIRIPKAVWLEFVSQLGVPENATAVTVNVLKKHVQVDFQLEGSLNVEDAKL